MIKLNHLVLVQLAKFYLYFDVEFAPASFGQKEGFLVYFPYWRLEALVKEKRDGINVRFHALVTRVL